MHCPILMITLNLKKKKNDQKMYGIDKLVPFEKKRSQHFIRSTKVNTWSTQCIRNPTVHT